MIQKNNSLPDLSKVTEWSKYCASPHDISPEIISLYDEARNFIEFYNWCLAIKQSYAGIIIPGIITVFLFKILPGRLDVDEWIWVIVGDLPPAYLTTDLCPNPAAAVDGYIGAMQEWCEAAKSGKSVADLIPVNLPATINNGILLEKRLNFLKDRILCEYKDDLKS